MEASCRGWIEEGSRLRNLSSDKFVSEPALQRPSWCSARLAVRATIHSSKVHEPGVAALGTGTAESIISDTTFAKDDVKDSVNDSSGVVACNERITTLPWWI